MGAEPYDYVVPYEPDIQAALDKLREKVFESGEYNGAESFPTTMEEAFEMTGEAGTASILDICTVSDEPNYCCASPFSSTELREYFGTEQPTQEMLDECDDLWEELERGMARYVILYENGQPKSIYFAGYSFD